MLFAHVVWKLTLYPTFERFIVGEKHGLLVLPRSLASLGLALDILAAIHSAYIWMMIIGAGRTTHSTKRAHYNLAKSIFR